MSDYNREESLEESQDYYVQPSQQYSERERQSKVNRRSDVYEEEPIDQINMQQNGPSSEDGEPYQEKEQLSSRRRQQPRKTYAPASPSGLAANRVEKPKQQPRKSYMPASPTGLARNEKPKSSQYTPNSQNRKKTTGKINQKRSPPANDSGEDEDIYEDEDEESPYIKNNKGRQGENSDKKQEGDVKQAVQNLQEVGQISEVVTHFEKNYFLAKKKMNIFDTQSLEADAISQALKLYYNIVQGALVKENPNFDKDQMKQQLEKMLQKVNQVNMNYTTYKGEFMAVSEPVVNKEMLAFKLDRVQRYQEKQDQILVRLPEHENGIKDVSNKLNQLQQKYENFERSLFEMKFSETKNLIKDTAKIIEKIQNQQDRLIQACANVKEELDLATPSNQEQKAELRKFMNDIFAIENQVESSIKNLETDEKEFEQLEYRHQGLADLLNKIDHEDILQSINVSRQLKHLVDNHIEWNTLNIRLKAMAQQSLSYCEQDLKRILSESKKYADIIRNQRREDYDELLRLIKTIAKDLGEDCEELTQRLEIFQREFNQDDGSVDHLSDADLVFLRKEVARYKGSVNSVRSSKEYHMNDSIKINTDITNNRNATIELTEVSLLQHHKKSLEKLKTVDIVRLRKNIDQLEAISVKALKNQLNDTNKISQIQISKMKKNYEDLQKQIDGTNSKIVKCQTQVNSLKDKFNSNEDLERENEIRHQCEDVLTECDRDVNGDKEGQMSSNDTKSLQARKKTIVGSINKMVNKFNEINKNIKESNRTPKSETEMVELIRRSKEIQDDCKKIDTMINSGKKFAVVINEKLDGILEFKIQSITEKYTDKTQAIDECDNLFEKSNAKIEKLNGICDSELEKLATYLDRLDAVNPINNPSAAGEENSQFLNDVQRLLDSANRTRDELENTKGDIGYLRDRLVTVVQPLNELGEREVKENEISNILKTLDEIHGDLEGRMKFLFPKIKQVKKIGDEVDDLLNKNKSNKVNDALDKIRRLDANIGDLNGDTENAFRKLTELKTLMKKAKQSFGRDDIEEMQILKRIEEDMIQIEIDLKETDSRMKDLRKKRNESAKLLDNVQANPDKFTSNQMDELLNTLDEQIVISEDLVETIKQIEQDLDKDIHELKDMMNLCDQRHKGKGRLQEILDQMRKDMNGFRDINKEMTNNMDDVEKTLKEMKIGSGPDDTADYWEEKEKIERFTQDLRKIRAKWEYVQKFYQKKNKDIESAEATAKKIKDVNQLNQFTDELDEQRQELSNKLKDAQNFDQEVQNIRKDMDDCEIPVNIALRRSELEGLSERLDRMVEDFKDLKQADLDYEEGDTQAEREIKGHVAKIEKSLALFVTTRKELFKYQTSPLEKYSPSEYRDFTMTVKIIIQIREFKERIKDTNLKLGEVEDLMNDLQSKLIAQDIDNATRLLRKKSNNLRERLDIAKGDLTKIQNTGQEMDGNTTQNEEDEYIDTLREEMPQVFKNVEENFSLINKVDQLLDEVIKTKNINKMGKLKDNIDEATAAVEESEGLVLKLEGELIEWNAKNKLVRRDEELAEINELLGDFKEDLMTEYDNMQGELEKFDQKFAETQDQGEIQKYERQQDGVEQYISEITQLDQEIDRLAQKRVKCFKEFDGDIPKIIKEERVHRIQFENSQLPPGAERKKVDFSTASSKADDIYYMLHINCRYRLRIHTMLKDLRLINDKRRALEEKWLVLKQELATKRVVTVVKQVKKFRSIKGDEVDKMFMEAMNRANLDLRVKRISQGKYLFGTRNIMAKIINNKLVIRVGGGYMGVDEFIDQYGKIEMLKQMKADGGENEEMADDILKHGGGARSSVVGNKRLMSAGLGAFKEDARDGLAENATLYKKGATNTDGGFGTNSQTKTVFQQAKSPSPRNRKSMLQTPDNMPRTSSVGKNLVRQSKYGYN